LTDNYSLPPKFSLGFRIAYRISHAIASMIVQTFYAKVYKIMHVRYELINAMAAILDEWQS
jgi:hypothetical protein